MHIVKDISYVFLNITAVTFVKLKGPFSTVSEKITRVVFDLFVVIWILDMTFLSILDNGKISTP